MTEISDKFCIVFLMINWPYMLQCGLSLKLGHPLVQTNQETLQA